MVNNKKIFLLLAAAFILTAGLFVKELVRAGKIGIKHSAAPLIAENSADIPIVFTDQIYGNPGAPVTVVEFMDFSCSACRKNYYIIKKIIEQNPTKMRAVFKDAPIGGLLYKSPALPHLAAFCAGKQNQYWPFADNIVRNGARSPTELQKIAAGLNLKIEEWKACLDSDEAAEKIDASLLLAKNLGLKSLPAVFVNNQKINPENDSELEKILEMFLKKL